VAIDLIIDAFTFTSLMKLFHPCAGSYTGEILIVYLDPMMTMRKINKRLVIVLVFEDFVCT
jgi:hypothetical protein